ncbi:hypothetical protein E4U23_000811 [Claviceps purpurea]|nr:hypothetical protein E4U23_000811 [Claviceps purpurea]
MLVQPRKDLLLAEDTPRNTHSSPTVPDNPTTTDTPMNLNLARTTTIHRTIETNMDLDLARGAVRCRPTHEEAEEKE